MKPLIVITGPTASGKTAWAVKMAKEVGGEIVNADAIQVYKYMDIGSAKPTMEEREGIPHYLMDEIEPTVNFSVVQYNELAHKYIAEIHEKGKIPILTGGSGMYIESVVDNIKYNDGGADEEYRQELSDLADLKGNEVLHGMLKEIDPESANRISPSDRKRMIRALEVYKNTGITITEQQRLSKLEPSPYDITMYGIEYPRELLYERINKRVDLMIEAGLVDEVKKILKMGVTKENTSMQGIGYKEIASYLDGEMSFTEAIELIKQGSRRYAKRQMTWFRRDKRIKWVNYLEI